MKRIAVVLLTSACTTLGPMPAATGIAPLPAARSGVEVQAGAVPGFYLSGGVTDDPRGSGIGQLAALFDGGEALRHFYLGARVAGNDGAGTIFEPMIGSRHSLGEGLLGVGWVVYGTHAKGDSGGASYSATRLGAEVGWDFRLTPRSKWIELHAVAGTALTGIDVDGKYCLDDAGLYGADCPMDNPQPVDISAGGLYPSAQLGLMFDLVRHHDSAFHGVRAGFLAAGGTMPTARRGVQGTADGFVALGLLVTVGLGAAR